MEALVPNNKARFRLLKLEEQRNKCQKVIFQFCCFYYYATNFAFQSSWQIVYDGGFNSSWDWHG